MNRVTGSVFTAFFFLTSLAGAQPAPGQHQFPPNGGPNGGGPGGAAGAGGAGGMLPPGGACGNYVAGQSGLTWAQYDALRKLTREAKTALDDGSGTADAYRNSLGNLNASMEAETTAAMLEVFSNPKSKVLFGGYTELGKRKAAKDGGEGFRVIWQLEKNGKLISVITFWKPGKSGQPEMILGDDSVRVRTQIEDFKRGDPIFKAVAQSYSVSKNPRGVAFQTGFYPDKKGEMPKHLGYQSNAQNCFGCHDNFPARSEGLTEVPSRAMLANPALLPRNFRADFLKNSVGAKDMIDESLKIAGKIKNGNPVTLDQLFDAKKTFLPTDLVKELRARCRLMARGGAFPLNPAARPGAGGAGGVPGRPGGVPNPANPRMNPANPGFIGMPRPGVVVPPGIAPAVPPEQDPTQPH